MKNFKGGIDKLMHISGSRIDDEEGESRLHIPKQSDSASCYAEALIGNNGTFLWIKCTCARLAVLLDDFSVPEQDSSVLDSEHRVLVYVQCVPPSSIASRTLWL